MRESDASDEEATTDSPEKSSVDVMAYLAELLVDDALRLRSSLCEERAQGLADLSRGNRRAKAGKQGLEIGLEVCCARIALVRIGSERLHADALELRGDVGVDARAAKGSCSCSSAFMIAGFGHPVPHSLARRPPPKA